MGWKHVSLGHMDECPLSETYSTYVIVISSPAAIGRVANTFWVNVSGSQK
jgi:hypothetical protein